MSAGSCRSLSCRLNRAKTRERRTESVGSWLSPRMPEDTRLHEHPRGTSLVSRERELASASGAEITDRKRGVDRDSHWHDLRVE